MERVIIRDDIWTYVFDNTLTITVLVEGNKATLIDCGMLEEAEAVKYDLDSRGIDVDTILFTHYHPDHVGGSTLFESSELISSSKYEENYRIFSAEEDDSVILECPTRTVDFGELNIHGFNIKVHNGEGHSECGLIFSIDDIVIVGDLMMRTLEQLDSIPTICSGGSLIKHIDSLKCIKKLNPTVMIMGHGNPILGTENIVEAIDSRLFYLDKLRSNPEGIDIEECLLGNLNTWVLKEAHTSNLEVYNLELSNS